MFNKIKKDVFIYKVQGGKIKLYIKMKVIKLKNYESILEVQQGSVLKY
jgi:hypothetical protein